MSNSLSDKEFEAIARTTNRNIGNPICITHKGQEIDLDCIQSVKEYMSISKNIKLSFPKILEIGAGYGRTAHVILNNCSVNKYCIIDLPEILKVSENYLAQVLSIANFQKCTFISTEELETSEETLTSLGIFDLAINIDSFAEMEENVVLNYSELLNRISNNAYIKNPVGKYESWMISNDSAMQSPSKTINDAMASGLLREIVNINNTEDVEAASKKFVDIYRPSKDWSCKYNGWAVPWNYYWEAFYELNRL